jgi:hypothetical protein
MDSSNDSLSSVSGSGGTQGTTNDPQQDSSNASTLNGQTSNLQPSTSASDLLTSNSGIALSNNDVPSTTLRSTSSVAITPDPTTVKTVQHHGYNPFLLTVSVVLFIAAVVMFLSTTRTAKTTTK